MQRHHILNASCGLPGACAGEDPEAESRHRKEYRDLLLMGTLAERGGSYSYSKNKNGAQIIIAFDRLLLYMKELPVFRHGNCSNEHIASEKNAGTFLFHMVIRNYKNDNKVSFQSSRNFRFS